MESLPAVLIVDDDRAVIQAMQEQLPRENYRVAALSSVSEALDRIRIERFGIILADQFISDWSGLDFLRICRETQPLSSRIMTIGMGSIPGINEVIASGDIFRVLRKPWTQFDLTVVLAEAAERYRLMEQLETARRETRRQRSDLAALGRQLESYRQQLLSVPAQPQQDSLADQQREKEELHRRLPRTHRGGETEEMRVRERTEELAWANLALESEISEMRRAEIQIRETNQQLQKTLEELHATQREVIQQERLGALGKMAGRVAHDFDNALIPVLGYAELLIERPELLGDRTVALKYLRLIRAPAKDATGMIGRLRDFYRQRDETEVSEPVDLLEALAEAISTTQPKWHDEALAQSRHITVDQEFRPLPMIASSRGEIRKMAANLIFNAVDALPQGGRIVVRAYEQEINAVLEIQDDGIGMTEEVRSRCLEPFVTTKVERGTGLGLAIVYGIVQRHHGQIEIESKLSEGSLVRVRLPLYQGVNPAPPAAVPQ
jgi:signal transduction histidine kinase